MDTLGNVCTKQINYLAEEWFYHTKYYEYFLNNDINNYGIIEWHRQQASFYKEQINDCIKEFNKERNICS